MTEEKTIQVKKSTLWMISTFVLLGVLLVFILVGSGIGSTSGNAVAPDQEPSPSGSETNAQVSINEDDPVLGDENAPVSVVEFSDFECPFCGRAHSDTLADFKSSSYFENGEANLVYKHLPLTNIHPNARSAAEASVCAYNQGEDSFWEYHDKLFENQQALGESNLKQYAADIGLDTQEFNNCFDSGEGSDKVSSDMDEASAAGARGTPHFVVYNKDTGDTESVSGAVPFANLEQAIQSVL